MQLANLNKELIEMGALCEQVIALAAKSLAEGDIKTAKKIFPLDDEIDQKERDIESMCLKMLLQQQPVARDLRQISAALKMITDMERIGDQASDIAEIIGFMGERTDQKCGDIENMARAAIKMVTESVEAYVVDDYFKKIKTELIEMISENPDDGEYAIDLVMIAKYFERIGDHATNIAEWVEFSVTGIHKGVDEL